MSISSPPLYGSPDWQRGSYSAQKLLYSGLINSGSQPLTVPPNTESLVVITQTGPSTGLVTCVGQTTGIHYGSAVITSPSLVGTFYTYIFDAAPALDAKVLFATAPTFSYNANIYADAAAHISVDPTKAGNLLGQQYVIPTVPNTGIGDHPPNELQYISGILNASGNLIGGPGAGLRYRVFSAQMSPGGVSIAGYLQDAGTSKGFIYGSNQAGAVINYLPSGIPLSTNGAISYVLFAGSGNMYCQVVYTQEAV